MRIESTRPGRRALAVWLTAILGACGQPAPPGADLSVAEAFIDAFYSWDRGRLEALLLPGPEADAVLYYQGWAEAAHYQVQNRRPCRPADSAAEAAGIVCAITVTDDFGMALGYTATDTFTLQIPADRVASVTFAGDDPPVFRELFDWLEKTRPEVFSGPCRDLFAGGKTPADCARAVALGAREYAARTAD